MNDLVIIGICGKSGVGKDTAAAALCLHRGFHRVALADGVRDAFSALSGPTGAFHKELSTEHSFVKSLQMIGKEAPDEVNAPGLWADLTLTKIYYAWKLHLISRCRFVVPDVRFRHQSSRLRHQAGRWGGRFGVMRLIRPKAKEIAEASHLSETETDSVIVDREYINDGTIEDLKVAMCDFFDWVMQQRYIGLQ